jgi:cyclophilin family peptidyl-prolyl cis-trans isomerase
MAVLILLVVSVGGFYAYDSRSGSGATTSSQSTTTSSSAGPEYAHLGTSQGQIVIELYPQVAPKTVANFVSLANGGFYNDLVWHRLLNPATNSGFGIIQTGDPTSRGAINSTRDTWGQNQGPDTEPLESNSAYPNVAGSVAIAHTSSSTSGGSQFYINVTDNPSLNGQYTVFGQVVSGMSVVTALSQLPVYTNSASFTYDQPVNQDNALLISVTIESTP